MPERVMLVLPTATYRATAFLRAADRLGLEVVVASEEAPTLAGLMPGRVLTLDLGSPDGAAERARAFSHTRGVDAVVGVDESAVLVAAAVAEALGLRHSSVSAVAATRDKRRLRAALHASGVAQPRWAELTAGADEASVREAVARVGVPCVVKPVDLAASRGVIRADSAEEAAAAVARTGALLRSPELCGPGSDPPLLVEEYVAGPEVAVEGLLDDGRLGVLAVFDKPDPLEGPFFEETLLVAPSRHAAPAVDTAVALAADAVRALRLGQGPVHAELRLGPDGPRVIEVAARSIGGLCSGALGFVAEGHQGELSLEALILLQALGRPASRPRLAPGGAGALMLPIPAAGVLGAVEGVEEAGRVPGVVSAQVSIPRGERVVPLPEGDRYLGFVLARGEDPAAVESALRRAGELIRVEVAEPVEMGR